jgi:adenosyl cobinamide kinase/adenosyl cobinamide phosphate guanylyltransferase
MQPADDEKRRALFRAEEMEVSLASIQRDEQESVALLEKLDRLAATLFEHAQDWDSVSPEVATRVRRQEQQIHALRTKAQRLVEMQADEVVAIMNEIGAALEQARGNE